MKLRITHETRYRYNGPVSFSTHLLYLRPREHAGQRLSDYRLTVTPTATLSPSHDALGNGLVYLRFPATADHFTLISEAIVTNEESNPFDFILDLAAAEFPITYAPALAAALTPYRVPASTDTQDALRRWLTDPANALPSDTIGLLSALNLRLFEKFSYRRREEEGIQSATTTLTLGTGACRDLAVLFVELCRFLGLAARFVSGYLFAPDGDDHRTIGAMHAWAEVFLPGAGWRALDPTHGIWCDDRFIAVAHAVQGEEVSPVQGRTYSSVPIQSELDVSVIVERIP